MHLCVRMHSVSGGRVEPGYSARRKGRRCKHTKVFLSNKKHTACVQMKGRTSRVTIRTDSSFLVVTFNYLTLTAVTTFMLQWRDIRSVKMKNNL